MWKQVWRILAAVVLACTITAAPAYAFNGVNAKAAVLIEAETGRVLFAQNEHAHLPMASTTKIMTALLALEQENLDQYFTVDPQAIMVEGSSMGLAEGDQVTLRILAAGMLLASGNDGANAAAVRIAGSKDAFVKQMNTRARELGLANTSFETPSGLDGEQHYSSAYDMAQLARAALQNESFAALCSQFRMSLEYGNPPYTRWLKNHNRLLDEYQGAIGVKTGFTKRAGRCLVSAAERDGVRLICVTLSCPDDWRTHAQLMDEGFARLSSTDLSHLLPNRPIPVGGGVVESVPFAAKRQMTASLTQEEAARLQTELVSEPFLLAPVRAGRPVGALRITLDGAELMYVPLYTAEPVEARPLPERKQGPLEWLRGLLDGKTTGTAA